MELTSGFCAVCNLVRELARRQRSRRYASSEDADAHSKADSLRISNAVALIGVLIGPCYPVAISVLTKVIPRRLHATSIGFCASFGQIGAAVFPFAVGALAQRFSPAALQPVMVVLFAIQAGLWWLVPNPQRKKE